MGRHADAFLVRRAARPVAHAPPPLHAAPVPDAIAPNSPHAPLAPAGPPARRGLPLLHRLLAAGAGDVAELRGWDRLISWQSLEGGRARWQTAKRFAKLPARAAREARDDVHRFGHDVAELAGVPTSRQLRQLWWLKVRYGTTAASYLDYQLYRPERFAKAGEYVQEREFNRVIGFLKSRTGGDDVRMIYDKQAFDEWCRTHALPTVPTLMEFEQGRASHAPGWAGSLPERDLFTKPSDGTGGKGTRRWRFERGGWEESAGNVLQAPQLMAALAQLSLAEPKPGRPPRRILLQECLKNHRDLLPLTAGGLCTVRLQTYRWPGGRSELLFGAYKMPVGDAPADNFHFGGLVAPVDLATGRLRAAIHRHRQLIAPIERHPTTGTAIAGHRLPHWEDAVRLVLRAHDAAPRLATIGWDVAILETGPVLVEGNTMPNPDIAQAPSGVPLGETPFVACLNAHLRELFRIAPARAPGP